MDKTGEKDNSEKDTPDGDGGYDHDYVWAKRSGASGRGGEGDGVVCYCLNANQFKDFMPR